MDKYFCREFGFSLFSVLLALSLLTFCILTSIHIIIATQNVQQQSYFESLAILQLQKIAIIIHTKPQNLASYLTQWQMENNSLFPSVQSKLNINGTHYYAVIAWKSYRSIWHCASEPSYCRSCFSLAIN